MKNFKALQKETTAAALSALLIKAAGT